MNNATKLSEQQGGLWFEKDGEKFFLDHPFSLAFLRYMTRHPLYSITPPVDNSLEVKE